MYSVELDAPSFHLGYTSQARYLKILECERYILDDSPVRG